MGVARSTREASQTHRQQRGDTSQCHLFPLFFFFKGTNGTLSLYFRLQPVCCCNSWTGPLAGFDSLNGPLCYHVPQLQASQQHTVLSVQRWWARDPNAVRWEWNWKGENSCLLQNWLTVWYVKSCMLLFLRQGHHKCGNQTGSQKVWPQLFFRCSRYDWKWHCFL